MAWVNYAGLAEDKHHALHKKYCPRGAGAVFTFGVKGGHEAGIQVVSQAKLLSHLANVGDTRSLIIHPASTTHSQLSAEQLNRAPPEASGCARVGVRDHGSPIPTRPWKVPTLHILTPRQDGQIEAVISVSLSTLRPISRSITLRIAKVATAHHAMVAATAITWIQSWPALPSRRPKVKPGSTARTEA